MRNTLTNPVIGKNQTNMIPGRNPLAEDAPVPDGGTGIGRPDDGSNFVKRAASHVAKTVKLAVERYALRAHKKRDEGKENNYPNDDKQYETIVHRLVWLSNQAAHGFRSYCSRCRAHYCSWRWRAYRWFGLRILEFRMSFIKARIVCLQRGYLAPDKGNLASYFRFICAGINHPVECVNVFLKCHSQVLSDLKTQAASSSEKQPPQTVENQRKTDAK